MSRATDAPVRWKCSNCGISVPVSVWPVRCSCGLVSHQPGQTKVIHRTAYPDVGIELERKVACACCHLYKADRCTSIELGCRNAYLRAVANPDAKCPLGRWDQPDIEFVTYEDMLAVTRAVMGQFPGDIDAVLGVPRSGVMAAGVLATAMHLPLFTLVDSTRVQFAGGGFRSPNPDKPIRRILVVDDSVSTGSCLLSAANHAIAQLNCQAVTFGLFVSPDSPFTPDFVGRWLRSPHWFEWNILNALTTQLVAVDMDGVICADTPIELLGDAEHGLYDTEPLTLPRSYPVRAIVIARLQVNEALTRKWLDEHKVAYKRLVVGPWKAPKERTYDNVVEFKAREYIQSGAKLFIESDEHLSRQIAEVSRKPVLCWSTRRMHRPTVRKQMLVFLSTVFRLGGVETWIAQLGNAVKNDWECVVAVPQNANVDGIMVQAVQQYARVVTGKTLSTQVCSDADLVVTSGGVGTRDTFFRRTGPTIFVSHLAGELGEFHARNWADARVMWAAVSEPAAQACPPGTQPVIVPHGVDPERLRGKRIHRKDLTLGYVGRFCNGKNYLAAARVAKELGCEVVYLGNGSKAATEAITATYERAKVLKPRLDVGPVYRQFDVFVQASACETGPITTLESMYCGTRVVSTPVGMLPEMGRQYGILAEEVPVNPTVEDLAYAVDRAVSDNETWKRARAVVREHYVASKTLGRWLELFATCVQAW